MPAKATRSNTTIRSRFSLWLRWKAIAVGTHERFAHATAPRLGSYRETPKHRAHREKGHGDTPPATPVLIRATLGAIPCPSYLARPSAFVSACERSLLVLHQCKQGGSCEAGLVTVCSRVTSESGGIKAESRDSCARWHHGAGMAPPGSVLSL